MKLPFRYRFFFSFVLLELLFLAMILFVNFRSLSETSYRLTEENIVQELELLVELAATPLSIYDLASLDAILALFQHQEHVIGSRIYDGENRLVSYGGVPFPKIDEKAWQPGGFGLRTAWTGGRLYGLEVRSIPTESGWSGRLEVLYDHTEADARVRKTQRLTMLLVAGEIALSLVVAFFLGRNLSRRLETLAEATRKIADDEQAPLLPVEKGNDELSLLAASVAAMQQKIRERTESLQAMNATLEERVREEVAKGRERDEIVSRQSRYAIMGETMTMVAHQWRQPLQNLVLMVEDFKEAFYAGELDQEYMETYGQEVIAQAIELSHTISEFSGFFTREKEKSRFSLAIPVREAADVIGFTMKGMGIVLEVRVPPEIEVIGYPREFRQVLINLLVNAKEVHMARGTPNPWIRVTGARRDGKGVLVVEDNAGGVAPELRERIFEPYFSTKGPASGTGVGLYISKVVVERNMEGTLVAENGEEGARFTVALPLA